MKKWLLSRYATWVLVLTVMATDVQGQKTVSIGAYLQEISEKIPLPSGADPRVIRLFPTQEGQIVVTANGVFTFQGGRWLGRPNGSGWRCATLDGAGHVWLSDGKRLVRSDEGSNWVLPGEAAGDSILCLMCESGNLLQVGTTNGLWSFESGRWTRHAFTGNKRIRDLTVDRDGDLWAATSDGLLRRMKSRWFNMDDHLMASGLHRSYFSVSGLPSLPGIAFGADKSVGMIREDGLNQLWRGTDGLPYGPATVIRFSGETLWMATEAGAIRKDSAWHYYHGRRWLPSNKVNDLMPLDKHRIWIATDNGISEIRQVSMTLAEKASVFEERIRLRHDRYGLVSASKLKYPGDLSSSRTLNNDNDGLWTSLYLAAECYRYAVTKDPEAKARAIRSYEALERLEQVTGISGYPARTFAAA
ncbi:MAG: hypothetical protein LWW85_01050, partial [Marinilabiliales bacterium]|nr:hypothetical protein [Marinilabiliales bacterium]